METMTANGGREAARYGVGGGGTRDLQSKQQQGAGGGCGRYFQMPLHYPRYSREDYAAMPEWQLDRLLSEYGLPVAGNLHQKRTFAMGAFLWGAGNGNTHSA